MSRQQNMPLLAASYSSAVSNSHTLQVPGTTSRKHTVETSEFVKYNERNKQTKNDETTEMNDGKFPAASNKNKEFQKNLSCHSTIARTPYKALFGEDPKLGLSSTYLSKNIISKLENEEDLQKLFEEINNNNSEKHQEDNTEQNSEKDQEEEEQQNVLVEVLKVDRGPLDSKNLIGKVLMKKNELYQVGTAFGIIKDCMPRNALLSCPNAELLIDIPEVTLPLRTVASMSS
ncbi:hypothetical protein WA026_012646 [Henosepilachna vigintioctopunctata]|uniref:Uncharacterized protein n=1 Tax=Henosepilachna vigintioctopunctata TaxID=420089 RepID=A0AAW1U1D1_9CUCU